MQQQTRFPPHRICQAHNAERIKAIRTFQMAQARRVAAHVQEHPDAYCPASGAARTSVRGAGIECDKQRRQGCAMTRRWSQGSRRP